MSKSYTKLRGAETEDEVDTEGSKLTRAQILADKNTDEVRVQDYIQRRGRFKINSKAQDTSALMGEINEKGAMQKQAFKVRPIRSCNEVRR